MRIVLWDTRHGGAYKDFAGGFGVGTFRGKGWRAKWIESHFRGDFRSPPLAYGYLAAQLRGQGHDVRYALDEVPDADVYVFNPALMTLPFERERMREIAARSPQARLFVVGQVANTLADEFRGVRCTVVRGEPEQLGTRFDEILEFAHDQPEGNPSSCNASSGDGPVETFEAGSVRNLDDLPFPDWRPFPYSKFGVAYDFSRFPTAYIQSSRGCALGCSYCPYIIQESRTRLRSPESVGEELRFQIARCGFQSFKFRDPLFGSKRKQVDGITAQIAALPKRIEFSVESRIEILTREVLSQLRDVGLTSVTVGIETPSRDTLLKYKRTPVKDDRQNEFVGLCRELGIRVVAGFMIGFPDDTRQSIRDVLRYAKTVNPFAANFNVCTPYPGTHWMTEVQDRVATFDWSKYDVYTPTMKYAHLTSDEVAKLHEKCFSSFYFRWPYLRENWRFLLPRLSALFPARRSAAVASRRAVELPVVSIPVMSPAGVSASALVELSPQAPATPPLRKSA
jgi:anaerobic magnesium-protoporphyrin IX monomethyl ester cyclase